MAAATSRHFMTEAEHGRRVAELASAIGAALALPPSDLADLLACARLHDIGKAGVPDAIVAKPGPLTRSEAAAVRRHATIGDRLARALGVREPVRLAIRHHHERWDGAGYPDGLRGKRIPLFARIIAIADAYDAITSGRPYAPARSPAEALAELKRHAGSQFDPRLTAVFCREIRRRLSAISAQAPRR
jgi:putative nucleotidyltransferase with HDIG domain